MQTSEGGYSIIVRPQKVALLMTIGHIISAFPGTVYFVTLLIVCLFFSVPHVRIQGAPDLHVDQGSVINLTCIISYSPEPPVYVFWYRGDEVR